MGIKNRTQHMIALEQDREWADKIPAISFPSHWLVKIIPPFSGAVIRFLVYKKNKSVSVYLDCYETLGYFGGPYWEIYPDKDYENSRYDINDTESLIKAIAEALE